jgi:hypothetical protein
MNTPTPHRTQPIHTTPARAMRALLLVTRLAPGITAAAVADIFKGTRDRHHKLAITGTMLFDGERFGVLLCGVHGAVGVAFDAISSDPRPVRRGVLCDGAEIPAWAAQGWRSGWSEPDALAALEAAEVRPDTATLDTWRALVGASDLL